MAFPLFCFRFPSTCLAYFLKSVFDSGEPIRETSGMVDIIKGKYMVVMVTAMLRHQIRIRACMLQLLFRVHLNKGLRDESMYEN